MAGAKFTTAALSGAGLVGAKLAALGGNASKGYIAYEQGTFVPTITFATPGTLAVVYSAQLGFYTRIGNRVFYDLQVAASTFTLGTASGNIRIAGLPIVAAADGLDRAVVQLSTAHTLPASVTQITGVVVQGTQYMELRGTGSGIAVAAITATHIANASNPNFGIVGTYRV